MKKLRIIGLTLAVALGSGFMALNAWTATISDIRNTRHNFSAVLNPDLGTGVARSAKAATVTRVCVFCHTPHHGTDEPNAPLWNRKLAGVTYTPNSPYVPYDSASLDASPKPGNPTGRSKLCLSCHDGTLALGSVNVFNGTKNPAEIPFVGTGVSAADQAIPVGPQGADSGFTRRLGVDLTNDHPISFTFDSTQASRDGELVDPAMSGFLGPRNHPQGLKPAIPLDDNKVECISCHDPHVRDKDDPSKNIKFLRMNRFQEATPVAGSFSPQRDIICLGCHDKAGWVGSAHAQPQVGNEVYQPAAASLREFPPNTQVWQAACLNCHDTHTVQGSRRLLREGTDGPVQLTAAGARYKQGGKPAIEEVCYACHSDDGGVLVGQGGPLGTFEPPDIKTDFTTLNTHMPISTSDQPGTTEVHNIGTHPTVPQSGKDFVEDEALLAQRHAECTDCHNPHRVMKNRLFNANNSIPEAEGTHPHKEADIRANNPQQIHSNLASGVLRGISGVEPVYAATEFGTNPVSFDIKYGDPGTGGSTAVSAQHVTREYQVCLKCHSNNAYGNTPPALGSFTGGTPSGTNSMTNYTNQAMEYNSPVSHQGEGTAAGSGAFAGATDLNGNAVDYVTNNHRSWHPVIRNTGRTVSVRGIGVNNNPWLSPFNMNNAVGNQTMYCTDCHGSDTPNGTVDPNDPGTGVDGDPWGPHGSNNNFLLKGTWDQSTGTGQQQGLCFKCHDYNSYGDPVGINSKDSGFSTANNTTQGCLQFDGTQNLHTGHAKLLFSGGLDGNNGNQFIPGNNVGIRCTFCHIAVPHGWKNKVFLANLNDVGLEAPNTGNAGDPGFDGVNPRQVRIGTATNPAPRYFNGPYYNGATLKVVKFAMSGQWVQNSCGSAGLPGNGQTGQTWMSNSSEACRTLP